MKKSVRLPNYILPERYEISLRPDLEAFVFSGEETIYLNLGKSVKEITLHSKELEIISVEFLSKSSISGKVKYNPKAETATLIFPKFLPKGQGRIKLSFRGILNDQLRGFYRSKYMHEGKEKFLATTQFEATDARRAFPCFDEPDKKAVFDVTLKVPLSHEAISNTLPIEILEHEGGIKAVRFEPTPKMSTYLLAFISGEFEYVQKKTKSGCLVRVFVTMGKKHQAKFALEAAVKILEFYQQYFAIKYPLPTLDMIAIPDFAAGAMENWGAVTYRESALLVDPDQSSSSTKQWVAMVIAHELAHQWFGNLVTMEWWTHLWLNEGFASYIEYLAVDHLYPDWQMWTQFVVLDSAPALQKDALEDTHPIEVDVHHPDEIGEIFDDISYHKGASVIRMLAGYLGEKDFRDGLRYYLKKHAYKNATTGDLWAAFEHASGKPIKKMMQVWTRTAGYPVLNVEKEDTKLVLRQKRFYINPQRLSRSRDKTNWPIPITFLLPGKKEVNILMQKHEMRLPSPLGPSVPKINIGETGFYRVAYEPHMWEWFAPAILQKKLPVLDRLGLANNIWTLAESGLVPTSKALAFTKSYAGETDYSVWLEFISSLAKVYRVFYDDTKIRAGMEQYVQSLLAGVIKKLGWKVGKRDSHPTKLLRVLALSVAGNFGNKAVVKKSKELFVRSKKNHRAIPADFRSFVYLHVVEGGGAREFELFKRMYSKAEMSEEQIRIGRAMTSFKNKALVRKALEFSLSSGVRTQDALRFNTTASSNPIGAEANWEFVRKNWDKYLALYGQGGHLLSRIVETLGRLKTMKAAKEVEAFFKTHRAPGAERTVRQVVEQIQINALWIKRDREEIESFFNEKMAKT